MKHNKNTGFTIVELLVMIAIMGILAALVAVAYNGIQGKSRDAIRQNDVSLIVKALQVYNKDNGDYAQAGCGNGTGTGYFSSDYDGTGPNKSVSACLTDGGYLTNVLVDPSGRLSCSGLSCHTYMKASCAAGTFVYAHLENKPNTTTDTDGTCQSTWDTGYGVNYYVKVDL